MLEHRHARDLGTHTVTVSSSLASTNLEHRGATGAETDTGDGAGILLQVPDAMYRAVVDFELPAEGAYATGIAFLPVDDIAREKAESGIDAAMAEAHARTQAAALEYGLGPTELRAGANIASFEAVAAAMLAQGSL